MPNSPENQFYRLLLESRLSDLESQDETNAESRDTVVLDQTSVGRLSRMDAMQQQAMAKATRQNRTAEIQAIKNGLIRLDEGEYGYCEDCGEDIPAKRLELTPTAVRCVGCANKTARGSASSTRCTTKRTSPPSKLPASDEISNAVSAQ
ncbi:MAG: TraR/DksA family transcriptional regulator [Paracoccaceae bacterium]